METPARIAIIGAGLTGLTTAWYLKKYGLNATIFEKSDRPGGVIRTLHENGFIYEAGPNTGVLGNPEALELLEDLNPECAVEVADQAAKARWIWKGKQWEPLPSGLISAIRTPLFSFGDKLRILGEPFRGKGKNPDETLAQLVQRRLGKSFLSYAVDPFILGIYAGDPNFLVTKYALPKLYNLEQNYGSFIRGTLKKAKEPKTERDKKATREIFSVKGGLQNLVDALVQKTGITNFRLDCREITISPAADGKFTIETASGFSGEFDYVVSTVGAHALKDLIPFAYNENLSNICCLKYAKVAQVSIGFKQWDGVPLRAFGGLVPFEEHRDILGALFISSFLKNRAPEGGALLSVFLGGLRRPEIALLPDKDILSIVERELKEMMNLKTFTPDLIKIHHYDHAIPQYGPESASKIKTIEELQDHYPGLILAGNIRDGIGMADRIKQGRTIAEQISGHINA
jgi:protoporphyrinogen/coproporphyrinogen III oxidase